MGRNKILFLSLFCVASGLSGETNFNTNKFSSVQKFYYELGREEAKVQYYNEGYSSAVADFKKMLKEYEAKIKELEAGKYLIEESKITYPQVYKTRTSSDGYQIHIEAPVVERAFSAEDLFIVPLVDHTSAPRGLGNPHIQYPNNIVASDGDLATDSFSIPSMSSKSNMSPSSPQNRKDIVYMDIRNSSPAIKEYLDASNSKYSATESGYRIEFRNESEKNNFCIGLTGEKNCYGLN